MSVSGWQVHNDGPPDGKTNSLLLDSRADSQSRPGSIPSGNTTVAVATQDNFPAVLLQLSHYLFEILEQ
jgi:hypothetical protein